MGLLDALNIGSQALLTHQAAIQVTGNNIANAATEGYARQQVLTAAYGQSRFGAGLTAGGGVCIDEIRRLIDYSVVERMNNAASGMAENQAAYAALGRVESVMNELTDSDLSNAMAELFTAFSKLQTDADNTANRDVVITNAQALINRFEYISSGLDQIHDSLTSQITDAVLKADELAASIAELNVQVVRTEAGGGSASSLRDQRDQLISQLSELIQIDTRENSDGAMTIYIGSEQLVSGGSSRGLEMSSHELDDGSYEMKVSFKDNNGVVKLTSGSIAGLQNTRDGRMTEILDRFDTVAKELIWQVNLLHTSGTPKEGYTDITGDYVLQDPSLPLDDERNGLAYLPKNGSFNLVVRDETTKAETATQINITLDGSSGGMTAEDFANAVSAVPGVTAEVLENGRVHLSSDGENTSFYFSEDSSGVLAALGLGTFFTGSSAGDIGVNEMVVDERGYIAAGLTGDPGNGGTAGAIAALGEERLSSLGGYSLSEYHQELITDIAVWTSEASSTATAHSTVYSSLSAQRESLSGVNIDEEAVNLMNFQSAFQGAARFISVINELMDSVLNMI